MLHMSYDVACEPDSWQLIHLSQLISRERNPIQVGQAIERKGFILDVALLLNDDTYVNIENISMAQGNGRIRFLLAFGVYLCYYQTNCESDRVVPELL